MCGCLWASIAQGLNAMIHGLHPMFRAATYTIRVAVGKCRWDIHKSSAEHYWLVAPFSPYLYRIVLV